jgi:predicted DNA-binding helix-hairpin-helix protein
LKLKFGVVVLSIPVFLHVGATSAYRPPHILCLSQVKPGLLRIHKLYASWGEYRYGFEEEKISDVGKAVVCDMPCLAELRYSYTISQRRGIREALSVDKK